MSVKLVKWLAKDIYSPLHSLVEQQFTPLY